MQLARKYTRGKWINRVGISDDAIPADVVYDLRTSDNSLSVWVRSEDNEIGTNEVVLALAAGFDRLDRIDIVWIEEEILKSKGIEVQATLGRTPVHSLVSEHRDIIGLNLEKVVDVGKLFAESISAGRTVRLAKSEVLEILKTAIRLKRLSIDQLQPKAAKEVDKALNT